MVLVLLAEEESPSRLRLQLLMLFALDLVNVVIYPFTFTGTLIELGSFENGVADLRAGPMTVAFSILIFVRAAILLVPFWFWMKKNPPSNSIDGGF
jgi:tryptophan-rich sensory protein